MNESPDSREQLARYLSEAQPWEKKQQQRQEMEAVWQKKLRPRPMALVP